MRKGAIVMAASYREVLTRNCGLFSLSLFGATDAVSIKINSVIGAGIIPVTYTYYIGNDGLSLTYDVGGWLDGCKNTKYNWIKNMCINDNRGRAHVNYSDGNKACFKRTTQPSGRCGGDEGCWKEICQTCYWSVFTPTACNWRSAEDIEATDKIEEELS
ncbi:hypothetical protein BKA59DRAFT_509324 [Fusarium tricinctum]|uniref:Uncharacterized protein n=1 Tax=Fusarium tricinctum TaxID=61284 RepID=A0A8K0S3X2_9HYPO|nr:hypothetical protein BKA59DRAFT_509324 [Fusarium tricinctum]